MIQGKNTTFLITVLFAGLMCCDLASAAASDCEPATFANDLYTTCIEPKITMSATLSEDICSEVNTCLRPFITCIQTVPAIREKWEAFKDTGSAFIESIPESFASDDIKEKCKNLLSKGSSTSGQQGTVLVMAMVATLLVKYFN